MMVEAISKRLHLLLPIAIVDSKQVSQRQAKATQTNNAFHPPHMTLSTLSGESASIVPDGDSIA